MNHISKVSINTNGRKERNDDIPLLLTPQKCEVNAALLKFLLDFFLTSRLDYVSKSFCGKFRNETQRLIKGGKVNFQRFFCRCGFAKTEIIHHFRCEEPGKERA